MNDTMKLYRDADREEGRRAQKIRKQAKRKNRPTIKHSDRHKKWVADD